MGRIYKGSQRGPREELEDEARYTPLDGVAAGALGAFVVAVFFLVVDTIEGRPLWTPTALGAAVFHGQALAANAPIDPAMVLLYTFLHGALFGLFGLMAARVLAASETPGWLGGLGLATLLFVVLQLTFVGLDFVGSVFPSDFAVPIDPGRLVVANALASIAIAALLVWRRAHAPHQHAPHQRRGHVAASHGSAS